MHFFRIFGLFRHQVIRRSNPVAYSCGANGQRTITPSQSLLSTFSLIKFTKGLSRYAIVA